MGLGLAALLLAEQGRAYPGFDGLDLFSEYVMPANGVFVLGPSRRFAVPEDHGLTISVEGPGGPVSGSVEVVVGMLVFRPDRQLEFGEHTVTPIPADGTRFTGWQPTFTVQVTEPVAIVPPEAACSLSLAATLGAGSSEQCCGVLPGSWFTEPHCFATTANTHHVGLSAVRCPLDLRGASFSQVLCRLIDAPACEQRLLLDLWSTPCPSANNAPPESLEGPEFLWSASSDSGFALFLPCGRPQMREVQRHQEAPDLAPGHATS